MTCVVWGVSTWPNIAFTYSSPWSLKLPGNSCEARFPLEKGTTFGRGWQHHMWIHIDLWTQDAFVPEKTQWKWTWFLRRAFSSKKKRNVGAVGCESNNFIVTLNARRVLLEKTHWIWKGLRDARFSWKKIRIWERWSRVIWIYSHSERKTDFTWEHTRIWGGRYSAHFTWHSERRERVM